MQTLSSHSHRWAVAVEQSLLRLLLVAIGLALVLVGVPFALSIVLLPLGVFVALIGVGVIAWGAAGDVSTGTEAGQLPITSEVLHTPWDCRWSQVDHPLARAKKADKWASMSVCMRYATSPRLVTEADCANCKEWEPNGDRKELRQAA